MLSLTEVLRLAFKSSIFLKLKIQNFLLFSNQDPILKNLLVTQFLNLFYLIHLICNVFSIPLSCLFYKYQIKTYQSYLQQRLIQIT